MVFRSYLQYQTTLRLRERGGLFYTLWESSGVVNMKKRQGRKWMTFSLTRVFSLTTYWENCFETAWSHVCIHLKVISPLWKWFTEWYESYPTFKWIGIVYVRVHSPHVYVFTIDGLSSMSEDLDRPITPIVCRRTNWRRVGSAYADLLIAMSVILWRLVNLSSAIRFLALLK